MRSLEPAALKAPAKLRPLRFGMPVPVVGSPASASDRLIRELARDRIRELRDDGVTIGYIGRMYGVTGERMRQVEQALRR